MIVKLSDFIGNNLEEDFLNFDLSEIQEVLLALRENEAIDISHAEMLQQKALRAADILSEYLGKLVKTVGYLEAKINSTKNKIALEFQAPEGRTTIEMRKFASEASPEVEELQIKLAKAKGSKSMLEKKYDIIVKTHYQYKEVANGMRRTIIGHSSENPSLKFENICDSGW
jgi:DNA repair ATPase RecN